MEESDCCNADRYLGTDLCSECQENAEFYECEEQQTTDALEQCINEKNSNKLFNQTLHKLWGFFTPYKTFLKISYKIFCL